MAYDTKFPMFVSAEYDRGGSGFPEFEQAAKGSADRVRRHFEGSFAEISRLAKDALAIPRNAGGSLDLNVGEYRQAATAAQQHASALREIATAASRAAIANGDNSAQTRLYVQAARAAALEAENGARAATQQATAMERLQAQLNQTKSTVTTVATAQGRLNESIYRGDGALRSSRLAMVQTGQQLQDLAISIEGGQRIGTVFAQQLPQLAFAMQGFGGKVGAVAELLSGPWSLAVVGGAILLGTLADKFLDNSEAAKEAEKALKVFQDRQADITNFIDKTTGALLEQNNTLIQNAILLRQARIDANQEKIRKGRDDAFGTARSASIINPSGEDALAAERGGGSVQALTDPAIAAAIRTAGGDVLALDANLQALAKRRPDLKGLITDISTAAGESIILARENKKLGEELGQLQGNGKAKPSRELIEAQTDLATATDRVSKAQANLRLVQLQGDTAVKQGGKALQDYTAKLTAAKNEVNAARQAQRDATAARREHNKEITKAIAFANAQAEAEERIKRIGERFDAAPRLVDQTQAAGRELDEYIKKYPKLAAEAQRTKAIVTDALVRPFNDFMRQQGETLTIQRAILAGRYAEADALRTIFQLQQQMGPLTDAQRRAILETAVAAERVSDAIEDQRRRIGLYVSAVDDAQQTFERFLTGLDKKPGTAFKNLGKDLLDNFKNLRVRIVSEQLFGGLDREIERFMNGQTGPQAAIDVLETQATRTSDIFERLGDAAERLVGRLSGGGDSFSFASGRTFGPIGDATVNQGDIMAAISAGLAEYGLAGTSDSDEIIVTAQKKMTQTQQQAANDNKSVAAEMMRATQFQQELNQRLVDRLQKVLGVQLPANLSTVLSNALTGYQQAGPVGGVIGALKGFKGLPDKLDKFFGKTGVLDGAMQGAQTGTMIAGLGKALGIKMNSTGAQIGGALGSFLPIPGGEIIGSIAGGLLGGMLKKAKKGVATIGTDATGNLAVTGLTGNSGKRMKAAQEAADSTISTLENIAEQFGARVNAGAGSVSIGMRDGNYRVDPSGGGMTKLKNGAIDFGTDSAAALRAATLDLIKDGVLVGLKDGTKRLLQQAKDLDSGLDKALKFESVFTRLKEYTDPVGAALDSVNKEFESLKRVFDDAGASTEEYAQLEKLYGIERAKAIKETADASMSAIRSLRDDLLTGDNGLSLGDRLTNALAKYNPLAVQARDGSLTDYDAFADAARTVLDLQRAMSGSQDDYFDRFYGVKGLLDQTLTARDAAVAAATGASTPFTTGNSTTQTTGAANDSAPVVSALDQLGGLLGGKLDVVNSSIIKLLSTKQGIQLPTGFSLPLVNF